MDHVDKTTMALTSIIAEVDIASEGENFGVSTYTEGTTLKDFALQFKGFVDSCPELKSKIKKTAKK